MKRYAVMFATTASTVVCVDADSESEAQVLADEMFDPPTPCSQCSGRGRGDDGGNSGIELGEWEPDMDDGGVWEL